jgi:hypothetical protein
MEYNKGLIYSLEEKIKLIFIRVESGMMSYTFPKIDFIGPSTNLCMFTLEKKSLLVLFAS